MNNDFLVTREVICQWFSLVTSSLVIIIGKSPHSWLKIVIHGNSCIILYIWKDHLCIETDPATGSEILIYCCIRVMSHECSGIVLQLVQADNKEKINTLLAICEVNPPVGSDSRKSFPGHPDVIVVCALPSKSTLSWDVLRLLSWWMPDKWWMNIWTDLLAPDPSAQWSTSMHVCVQEGSVNKRRTETGSKLLSTRNNLILMAYWL